MQKPRRMLGGVLHCKKSRRYLLSPWTDYHRPQQFHGRVRKGNGCFQLGLVTGKLLKNSINSIKNQTYINNNLGSK